MKPEKPNGNQTVLSARHTHLMILLALCLIGIAEWVMEYFMDFSSGWFPRYGISKLLWLGIGIYIVASTVLVLIVGFVFQRQARRYTALGVILTHGIPVGLVVTGMSLGLHDRIEDAWRNVGTANKNAPISAQQPLSRPPGPRPLLPPVTPLPRQLPQAGGEAMSPAGEATDAGKEQ